MTTPFIAPHEELLLRLIASWGGFGWERVAGRYDRIVPPANRPMSHVPSVALGRLVDRGLVAGTFDRPLLTAQGREFLADRNRDKTGYAIAIADSGAPTMAALAGLVQAMAPQACEFFDGAEYDADIEKISVALDVAAAAIGVDLNPRTPEDERAGLGGAA